MEREQRLIAPFLGCDRRGDLASSKAVAVGNFRGAIDLTEGEFFFFVRFAET